MKPPLFKPEPKEPTKDEKKAKLWKAWRYEFEAWVGRLQSVPVELIKSVDKSQSYEMDRRHIFKLENGRYAFVSESGCSCYSASEAEIEVVSNIYEARRAWNKKIDSQNWNTEWASERFT